MVIKKEMCNRNILAQPHICVVFFVHQFILCVGILSIEYIEITCNNALLKSSLKKMKKFCLATIGRIKSKLETKKQFKDSSRKTFYIKLKLFITKHYM